MTEKAELTRVQKAARLLLQTEDVAVDTSTEVVSSGKTGYWVAARVYISKDEVSSIMEGADK